MMTLWRDSVIRSAKGKSQLQLTAKVLLMAEGLSKCHSSTRLTFTYPVIRSSQRL